MNFVARHFDFAGRRTTLAREVRGGAATFLTMAYILAVNPSILSAGGMPKASVLACTALAAAICCVAMGLYANFPIALASGMGLNAMVAFTLTAATGSWQTAMGLIVLDGLLILILVLLGLREAVMTAIPRELRLAIGAGIGLFIAFIGLQHGKIVVGDPATLVKFGELRTPEAATFAVGFVLTAALMCWRVPGAILIGISAATAFAVARGVASLPSGGLFAAPDFSTAFRADVGAALQWKYVPLLIAVTMVDFFDTLGTASAVAEEAGLTDEQTGKIPGVRRVLIVDSIGASVGGLLGVSSVTSYVESAAGVAEGARTGLHSVVVGLLFALCVFFAPVAAVIPDAAVAPALVLVGFLMMAPVTRIAFDDPPLGIPAFVAILSIPLTFSISHGIGYGLVTYVLLQMLRLRFTSVHPVMYAVAVAFLLYFLHLYEWLGNAVGRWAGA